MYYYTYLVICTQGSFIGKLYFGQHTTKNSTRTLESRQKQSKTLQGHRCYIKDKHRVYDNEEHTKWHFE